MRPRGKRMDGWILECPGLAARRPKGVAVSISTQLPAFAVELAFYRSSSPGFYWIFLQWSPEILRGSLLGVSGMTRRII